MIKRTKIQEYTSSMQQAQTEETQRLSSITQIDFYQALLSNPALIPVGINHIFASFRKVNRVGGHSDLEEREVVPQSRHYIEKIPSWFHA